MHEIKSRLFAYYEKNETKMDLAFFLAGFIFDIFTLSDIDDLFSVGQQVIYLLLVGAILYREFLVDAGVETPPLRFKRAWDYRKLAVHFFMGSLLSIYSLFFLKSASFFSSIIFVGLLMGLMVANELRPVQRGGINIRMGLYVICLLSFFSMIVPVILGFVGWVPLILSLTLTGLTLYGIYLLALKRACDKEIIRKQFLNPAGTVLGLFFLFYLIGWIPPVPLSVIHMGVYHNLIKGNGEYKVFHENPWWKFWNRGDQDFVARPGDRIHFFAQIFSPGRFDDSIILHWQRYDLNNGWMTTDKIPLRITGGRAEGYRGHADKGNYQEGSWRIKVETTDGREIGRIYLAVKIDASSSEERLFQEEIY